MAGIDLATAQAHLAAAEAALLAAGTQQEYLLASTTGSRKVVRAPYAELLKSVQYWNQQVKALTPNRQSRTSYAGFHGF